MARLNRRRIVTFVEKIAISSDFKEKSVLTTETTKFKKLRIRSRILDMWSIKITDHFTCTSANVIYCITCTLCKKFYIGETGRRLGDRFREHHRDVEKDDKNASKPVARQFNLINHSKQHMAVWGLSLHLGSTKSHKTVEQKFIFQIGTLNPNGIQLNYSVVLHVTHAPTNSVAPSFCI